jgi:5-methyltetrahydrofolate--homocysteine methyltransferase
MVTFRHRKNNVGVVLACNGFRVVDLGVMVPAEKILEESLRLCESPAERPITPSLDEMANVVVTLERAGQRVP